MKTFHSALLATALVGTFGATMANAEVVNIPYSAALQSNPDPDLAPNCIPDAGIAPHRFTTLGQVCHLDFPLTVPAGHTIQQIFVIHSQSSMYNNDPTCAIEASLAVTTLTTPITTVPKFDWAAPCFLPSGFTVESQPLMAQFGKLYPDQFQVLLNTNYQVDVTLTNGAEIEGIAVLYN